MKDLQENSSSSGLGEVLRLSWPASLTMLNGTILQFVDGLMVSFRGPEPFSAQFIASVFAFVPVSLALGTLTVVNTFVSQNLGAGRLQRCAQYTWAGVVVALGYWVAVAVLIPLAGPIFALVGHAENIRALEAMYFRYLIAGMGFFLVSRVLEQFFFGIHRSGIVLLSSLMSNLINVALNYVLIFGKLGFPALGLEGAAIGTVASTGLLVVILLAIFLSPRMHARFATRSIRTVKRSECNDLVRIGWPAGVRFCNGMLCWTVFVSVLVGMFGKMHLAANAAAQRYMSLSFMPTLGIGIATTALVGRYIGSGRADLARRRAHTAARTALVYTTFCGAVFLLLRHPMVSVFVNLPASAKLSPQQVADQTNEIIAIGGRIMVCGVVFQIFDALCIVFIGALRGAGDTFWPMIVTGLLSWGLLVAGGTAMVFFLPQLTSMGPWIVASAYMCVLGLVMAWRFESGAWQKFDLLARKPAAAVPAAEAAPVMTPEAVPTFDAPPPADPNRREPPDP